MKITEPRANIIFNTDEVRHIANCARVCYASNNSSNNEVFIKGLWKNKHRSMFRHAGVYYIIPSKIDIPDKYWSYIHKVMCDGKWYVSTNRQCAKECMNKYKKYEVHLEDIMNTPDYFVFKNNQLIYISVCVETGIDITREYNRKSPNAIAEQSTRYVDFIKKIGIKFKKCHWMNNLNIWKRFLVKSMCKVDEWFYKISRSKYGLNLPAQDARWCLFLDTMSKVVYTYTLAEWEYIINMRFWDYTGTAHKDAKEIARQIKNKIESLGYTIHKYDKEEDEFEGCYI